MALGIEVCDLKEIFQDKNKQLSEEIFANKKN